MSIASFNKQLSVIPAIEILGFKFHNQTIYNQLDIVVTLRLFIS